MPRPARQRSTAATTPTATAASASAEYEQVQHVVARDDERHRRQGGQRRHAEREPPATAHRAKSPRGRATSTARKMTRPTTSRYGPPNANALAASARPRTRPPTKVPSIEPSPARPTTMSAFSVHSSPMDGLIEEPTLTSARATKAKRPQ